MRFYLRTSKRTGVSAGPIGAASIGFLWLCLIGLPVAIVAWSFHHWYTAPIGVVVGLLALLAALGRFLQAREK